MSTLGQSNEPDEISARELYLRVSKLLGNQVQSLAIEVSDDGIGLRGLCDTYYIKQLAQEAIGRCTSRRILSNLIVVREPSAPSDGDSQCTSIQYGRDQIAEFRSSISSIGFQTGKRNRDCSSIDDCDEKPGDNSNDAR